MKRVGFVIPRYGLDVLGGAETFARQLAEHLPPGEFDATVLTTCARDLLTWRNGYPPGESRINGVRVLRFPIDHRRRDGRLFQRLTDRFNRGEPASAADQAAWLEHSAHSPDLYLHLARHGSRYDLLIFLPYLFGTTIYGSAIWPEKSVICPCLHDEPYAYFGDVRLMLSSARGLMFISPAEQALAESKLGVRHPAARLVGVGLDGFAADGERFRHKFGLDGSFVLYSGRLDPMKNVMQLLDFFLAYRQAQPERPLKLALAGSGPLRLPNHPDVVPLGFLDPADLHDAYAAALVLCQPSLVESFSIVLMEAWLAGTPALVHGGCPVTRDHVVQSNGGLYFTSAAEFAETLDWLLDHPQARQQMGALGRAYVQREYSWPVVLDRFRAAVAL
ncbi:MAG: glycosyltransferase family 4 protein [Anaerolineae bacterium]|nr:glycosyltransferase family 4 protein [Anaerolineae bacterium]